jgi:phosphoribosylformylglycinamidine synthase
MKAKIIVRLKPIVHDPQGEAILQGFHHMGYSRIESVRQGKIFDLEMQDMPESDARPLLEEVAHRILANPIIEEYVIEMGD